MKKIFTLAVIGAFSLVNIMMAGRAYAKGVSESTLVVGPTSQTMILVPGETYSGTIKVTNPNASEGDLDYSVSVGSFTQTKSEGGVDDYGDAQTDVVTNYNQIMDWIVIEKESGSVSPNETDVVPFLINVPKDAPAGGQYATILVQNNTELGQRGDGNIEIQSVAQFGSIIYAEVAGQTREVGEILENSMPSVVMNGTLEATSMVRNDGNVHTNARYIFRVLPLIGDEDICTNEEDPSKSLVLPETERYHVEECSLPLFGIFRASQEVTIFGETSVLEKTIFVCPLWLMTLIILAIVLLLVWLVFRLRSRGGGKAPRSESSASAGDAE